MKNLESQKELQHMEEEPKDFTQKMKQQKHTNLGAKCKMTKNKIKMKVKQQSIWKHETIKSQKSWNIWKREPNNTSHRERLKKEKHIIWKQRAK